MSRPPSPDIVKPGLIVVVRGLTSAGKSTIVEKITEGQSSWYKDGADLAAARGERSGSAITNAVTNSKLGKSVILDFGFGPANVVETLEKRLAEEGVSAPIFVALLYLPIEEIARRAISRSGSDARPNAATYLKGMPTLFSSLSKLREGIEEPKAVGEITFAQIQNAVKILNSTAEESLEEQANFLAEKLGVPKSGEPVMLYANTKHCDAVFQPTSYEEADRIAARIREAASQKTSATRLSNNSNNLSK